jgi:hypothetical protein
MWLLVEGYLANICKLFSFYISELHVQPIVNSLVQVLLRMPGIKYKSSLQFSGTEAFVISWLIELLAGPLLKVSSSALRTATSRVTKQVH